MKYIIKNTNTGKYINIDQNSGGYPYETDVWNAYFFNSFSAALDYKRKLNLDNHIIEIAEIKTTNKNHLQ